MKKHKFIVELEIPPDVNITEMKRYIDYSINMMCGSLNPIEDPLFDLNRESIKVTHMTKAQIAKLSNELLKTEVKRQIPGNINAAIDLYLKFGDETTGKTHNGYYGKGGWPYETLKKFLKSGGY